MKPYLILHSGVSLDGRMDYGPADAGAPYYSLLEYIHSDADLSGSVTMLKATLPEDPHNAMPDLYEMWISKPDRPLLAVVDSRGQVRNWPVIKKQPFWRDFVALCSRATPPAHLDMLREQGVHIIQSGEERVDLGGALEQLNQHFGVRSVRVDSGGILIGALLRAGLVDEVNLVVSPCLVGGSSPSGLFAAPDLTSPQGILPLKLLHAQPLPNDYLWLRYQVLPCGQTAVEPSISEEKTVWDG